jgi:hypothetical protein
MTQGVPQPPPHRFRHRHARTLVLRSDVFDLSNPPNAAHKQEPWGRDCVEAIRDTVSSASFAVDGDPDFDDDGWLLIAKKDSEVYTLQIHAFTRRSVPGDFWWACHITSYRTFFEWLTGRSRRLYLEALCTVVEEAVRVRGKATEMRWMTSAEFNGFS